MTRKPARSSASSPASASPASSTSARPTPAAGPPAPRARRHRHRLDRLIVRQAAPGRSRRPGWPRHRGRIAAARTPARRRPRRRGARCPGPSASAGPSRAEVTAAPSRPSAARRGKGGAVPARAMIAFGDAAMAAMRMWPSGKPASASATARRTARRSTSLQPDVSESSTPDSPAAAIPGAIAVSPSPRERPGRRRSDRCRRRP